MSRYFVFGNSAAFLDANIVSGDRLLDWVTKEVQGLCKAQGKDSRGSKGKREEMGVEGGL